MEFFYWVFKVFFSGYFNFAFCREPFILWHYNFAVELKKFFWRHFYFADFSGENFLAKIIWQGHLFKKITRSATKNPPVMEPISKTFSQTTQYLISVIRKYPLLSLKLQIWYLNLHSGQIIECRFTLKLVLDMTITHS